MAKTSLVITSIAGDTHPVLQQFAKEAAEHGVEFIVIGDQSSPSTFNLPGARFYSLDDQRALPFSLARITPVKHYTRKNLGYLLALSEGTDIIIETDDDNIPEEGFWSPRERHHEVPAVRDTGWLNIYKYFTDAHIWPRGFPLSHIHSAHPEQSSFPIERVDAPIQQGLAQDNPDIDAVYRLTLQLPQRFNQNRIALGKNAWSPFNSQNTTWWREAAPLLYLPSYCTFRMTDIWRSFVAQRVVWENDWHVLYHEATVRQERNDHDLMKDFEDEIPGYRHNAAIARALDAAVLAPGVENTADNVYRCYEALIAAGFFPPEELTLLRAWLDDIAAINR